MSFLLSFINAMVRKLIETVDGKEFVNYCFTEFLKGKYFERNSIYTPEGPLFALKFTRTICDLLIESVFQKRNAVSIDILSKFLKKE